MKGIRVPLAVFVLLTAFPAFPQRDPAARPPGDNGRPLQRPGRADPQNQRTRPGPWNRDLTLQRAPDGWAFGASKPFVERAGVPCLIQEPTGRLIAVFQWFPMEQREAFDRIGVSFSEDAGKNWTPPRRVEFQELPPEYERQFDPTLVALEDGRFRLYFTSNPGRENTAIYSAISSDAIRFTFEPGQRFGAAGENVVDCSVAKLGDTWHLFAPLPRREGSAFHAISRDGLKFERQENVSVPGDGTWIGNVLNVDGALRFYGSGRSGIWSATSRDGAEWQIAEMPRTPGGDPAVCRLKGADYVLIVTGDLRADAPMDPPWRRDRVAGLPALPDPMPDDAPRPRFGEVTAPAANVAVTANSEHVFVVREGVLYQFGARDLNFIKQTNLPEPPRRVARPPAVRRPDDRHEAD